VIVRGDVPAAEPERASYYVRIRATAGRLEEVLARVVAPVLRQARGFADLDAAYFARFQDEALLFVLGAPVRVASVAREAVEPRIEAGRFAGIVERAVQLEHEPETKRYGGPAGMRLAEKLFAVDSLAALDLLETDARGGLAISRREWSLLATERFLDLLRFDRERRLSFYALGYAWAVEDGRWNASDLRLLEERYRAIAEQLRERLSGSDADADARHGGAEGLRILREWNESNRPLVEELLETDAARRGAQDIERIAWSLAHLHCNRLGIAGDAEAILRFYMQRFWQERGAVNARE
jgi:thiopeptide-type bacteriocin biosynthesis protein